jgi:hypothetical protein
VAQLVARTAGGREVAGSSPVTPTIPTIFLFSSIFRLHLIAAAIFFYVYINLVGDAYV